VAPRLCGEFQDATLAGNFSAALSIQDRLLPLHMALFIENSPAPTKYALSLLGKCSEQVRLPLGPISENGKRAVREAMVHAGLMNA
jgi:4-hydroxy-tetrahydrodipicolinate synthase